MRTWLTELDQRAARRQQQRSASAVITDRGATEMRAANRDNPSWQRTHDAPDPDDTSEYMAAMRPDATWSWAPVKEAMAQLIRAVAAFDRAAALIAARQLVAVLDD